MPNHATSQRPSRAISLNSHQRPHQALHPRVSAWVNRAAGWVRAAVEALAPPAWGDRVWGEFAAIVASAREPSEIDATLVRLAHQMSGARLVELYRGRSTDAVRITCWPPSSDVGPALLAEEDDPSVAPSPRSPLRLTLRVGDCVQGTLRVIPEPGRRWSRRLVHRMTTLCVLAAAAERSLRADRPVDPDAGLETIVALRDATFLNAVLPYAVAQAKRHREPLSLLCVGIDRLAAIHELHGPEVVRIAVQRVSDTIVKLIRASDVVARLEDDRMIVVLPISGVSDSLRVAEVVCSAIAAAGTATTTMPMLTASIGVACFPTHAQDIPSLIAAADDAMARAEHEGRNRVAVATSVAASPPLILAHASVRQRASSTVVDFNQ